MMNLARLTRSSRVFAPVLRNTARRAYASTTATPVTENPASSSAESKPPPPSAPKLDESPALPMAGEDWSKSYYGLSREAFSKEKAEVLLAPIDKMDIEMKPGTVHCLILKCCCR